MLPVVNVFFELGQEGAAPGEGIEAFLLADIMRHTRLEASGQVLVCLEVLDQAVQRVRNDPAAIFHAADERGYCLVAAQTQRSIRGIWQQIVSQRELIQSPVSSHTQGSVSARLAPDLFAAAPPFLTASPSGPAVPFHEIAPSMSSDGLGTPSAPPPTTSPGAAVAVNIGRSHAPSPSGQAGQAGQQGMTYGIFRTNR
jgi:hypothetical protein